MFPYLFQTDLFGYLAEPWTLHTYGLLIAIGFLVGMNLAARQADREGEDSERIVDLTFYVLIWGLLGGRLVYILTKFDHYLAHPLEIGMFWRGGLVWYGGFLAACAYLAFHSRTTGRPFFKTVDILIPSMALAHAAGRLGCLAAGCCFGEVTHVPWAIRFPPQSLAQQVHHALGLVRLGEPSLSVHPTQLYEAGGELALFFLLIVIRPYRRFHGQLFLMWLGLYPIMRTVIEMYRGDKERGVYILSTSQYISIGVGLAAILLVLVLRHQRAREEPKAVG